MLADEDFNFNWCRFSQIKYIRDNLSPHKKWGISISYICFTSCWLDINIRLVFCTYDLISYMSDSKSRYFKSTQPSQGILKDVSGWRFSCFKKVSTKSQHWTSRIHKMAEECLASVKDHILPDYAFSSKNSRDPGSGAILNLQRRVVYTCKNRGKSGNPAQLAELAPLYPRVQRTFFI